MLPASDWKKTLKIIEKFPDDLRELGFHELVKVLSLLDEAALEEIANWLKRYRGSASEFRSAMSKLHYITRKKGWF